MRGHEYVLDYSSDRRGAAPDDFWMDFGRGRTTGRSLVRLLKQRVLFFNFASRTELRGWRRLYVRGGRYLAVTDTEKQWNNRVFIFFFFVFLRDTWAILPSTPIFDSIRKISRDLWEVKLLTSARTYDVEPVRYIYILYVCGVYDRVTS